MSTSPSVQERDVLQALADLRDPQRNQPVVEAGLVRNLKIEGGDVRLDLALPDLAGPVRAQIKSQAERAVMGLDGVASVQVNLPAPKPTAPPPPMGAPGGLPPKQTIPGTEHVIAVSSGKGGVGKSTVAVNLACALQQGGSGVGILDGDVYGPNVPLMLGVQGRPEGQGNRIHPFIAHNLQVMSMGLLVPDDQPMIWRGPMLNKAVQQFLFQVDWKDLNYLVVDMPPGTGDVQLTLTQSTDISGAVIVTTPQQVSVLDVMKAIRMFEKMGTPILGIVENMSWFQPPGSEERYPIFGEGGGQRVADEFGLPLLGQVPIGVEVRTGGDQGQPITVTDPEGAIAQAFRGIADRVKERVSSLAAR